MKTSSFTMMQQRRSPLMESQNLKPERKKKKSLMRELALVLPLTSLIDAFSIIVIYLLIGTQTSGAEVNIPGNLKLPSAEHSISLEKDSPTLRIQNGVYRLNEEVVTMSTLRERLLKLKKTMNKKDLELLVQADQEMPYQQLDPILKASAASGFEKMKFAVVPAK